MGGTDPRAVESLRDLPNTQIRVSYDTARTRLHAKAYIIHRGSGFGCAYIGSAKLSRAALSEGLEWTSKISQYELPHLWEKILGSFDYQRFTRAAGAPVPLLFVAHREEILRQALATYRAVLRDQNFGDLLVGGFEPEQTKHLFCSIQSYNSRELWRLAPERFRYVVVDEFHHAAAASYRRLLDHVRPQVLLGLAATPERSDELDTFHWFGGEPSAEIRLPDAINRRLLCPFQYFGVSDCVDLDSLQWQRGGYLPRRQHHHDPASR